MSKLFKRLFVLGRPASGKSEFLDFLRKRSDPERAEIFHIGMMHEMDDFVWLWEKFEDDDLWEKAGAKRIDSIKTGPIYDNDSGILFDFLMEKFNFEIGRKFLDNEVFYNDHTLLIEFSRGGEKPYSKALGRLAPSIFRDSAIFYIEVSGQESLRRNEARYQEKLKHSVLAHKCPDKTMARFYKEDDWQKLTNAKRDGFIELNGVKVPFVTMNNEPESVDPNVLTPRYGAALSKLWELYDQTNS